MAQTKSTTVSRAQSLSAGTSKHVVNATFAGATYTSAQLVTLIQSFIALFTAVNAAKQQVAAALLSQRDQAPALASVIALYRAYVLATFAKQPAILADFGLTVRKTPAPKTAEEKFEASLQRAATRTARGTVGKKAKLKITGVVTPVTVPARSAAPLEVAPATASATVSPSNGSGHGSGGQ